MNISFIIPAINEASCIGRAVTSALDAGADEVIVVDGGSCDGTQDLARSRGSTVLTSSAGRGVQQNVGARHAQGDVLLFQHADSWFVPSAGQQIRTALEDSQVVFGAFRQHIAAGAMRYRALEWGNAWRVRLRGLAYGDQGIFLRRQTFFELGQFPDEPIMEDLILMRAARGVGRPVLLPGPIHVDPRRWQRHGVVRQTLRNWSLLTAYYLGVSPRRLARHYQRHDAG